MGEQFLEILKYTIPALVVFATAFFMMRATMQKEYKLRQIELKFSFRRDSLPIRFQAFERLTIFLERITFSNMIQRVRRPAMSSKELHIELLSTIRAEYEHNISQQIYISNELWNLVTICKDEMIKILNIVAASLPPDSSGNDLSKAIFEFLIESEVPLPTQKALDAIQDEVKAIF